MPVVPATEPLPEDMAQVASMAKDVGYPVMLKASWGGGGRGMRVIRSKDELEREVTEAKREATREKRLQQAIEWMAEGKSKNWKYENC